jgi:CIC family chloride channel protein
MATDDPFEVSPRSATTDGLTVSPALDFVVEAAHVPPEATLVDRRILLISSLAVFLGVASAAASVVLVRLIAVITNIAFFQQFSFAETSPADNRLGLLVIVVPIVGAVIIGFMARYGSRAIRGHGIPEAMEQVLTNESRIPARVTFLKPLSAAISIGTGGPFGAEGPIIATGGALGSQFGQIISVTAAERKTLLAAGAAAGMAATFGSPVSAVLLAVELLLFEYRARSIIPVALASATAAGIRIAISGGSPVFAMPNIAAATLTALGFYAVLGCFMGVLAVAVTRLLYFIEDSFEKLPIHWMWWPAIGAVAVGVVGYFAPATLGVGYNNITDVLAGNLPAAAVLILATMKLISWSIALGSGTSGGTLAPMFTIGGAIGSLCGLGAAWALPTWGIDPRVAALVGMAAMFGGASRAFLASAVFAFEATQQPLGLLPLLAGCSMAYLTSCLMMRHTLMTEKIARRGIRAPVDYVADVLDQILVREVASHAVVTLCADEKLLSVREWLALGAPECRHQGFPVLETSGALAGVVTRREILDHQATPTSTVRQLLTRPLKFVYDDTTVRQAVEHMANHDIGRLPVVTRTAPPRLVGMLTRSDVVNSFRRHVAANKRSASILSFREAGQRGAGNHEATLRN